MKENYFNKTYILLMLAMLCTGLSGHAQTAGEESSVEGSDSCKKEAKKAWEIGVGISGFQMSRFCVLGFQTNQHGGYSINTSKRDLLGGGQFYLARELNSHFYVDLQGNVSYTSDPVRNGNESRWAGMAGLGLQWRLGEYFHSTYIDPFLRSGINYLHKNFRIDYAGLEMVDRDKVGWNLLNDFNKEGCDKYNLIPFSFGAGVNMWLNDRAGIALQADYLLMPYQKIANLWQGSVRFMWRFGGKSKRPKSSVQYIEKVTERIVEKPVVVEKFVEVQPPINTLGELFHNVYFDFDQAEITPKSAAVIDRIAQIMMKDTDKMYLITGCTDAKGSLEYNMALSQKRADAVVEALVQRGYPAKNLKARGVGKLISYASQNASDEVREGDRKIMVEIITNKEYWNHIP